MFPMEKSKKLNWLLDIINKSTNINKNIIGNVICFIYKTKNNNILTDIDVIRHLPIIIPFDLSISKIMGINLFYVNEELRKKIINHFLFLKKTIKNDNLYGRKVINVYYELRNNNLLSNSIFIYNLVDITSPIKSIDKKYWTKLNDLPHLKKGITNASFTFN